MAEWCAADPGPFQTRSAERSRVCSASLRAARRPGHAVTDHWRTRMPFDHRDSTSQGIGRPVPRKEDARLVIGAGRFSDDISLPGQAYAAMVRSPHAHARIVSIAVDAALASPGVLAVLTGADARRDGLNPIPHNPRLPDLPDISPRL